MKHEMSDFYNIRAISLRHISAHLSGFRNKPENRAAGLFQEFRHQASGCLKGHVFGKRNAISHLLAKPPETVGITPDKPAAGYKNAKAGKPYVLSRIATDPARRYTQSAQLFHAPSAACASNAITEGKGC